MLWDAQGTVRTRMAIDALPQTTEAATRSRNAVTTRALLLGTLLIVPNTYWVIMVEGIWHTGHPTAVSLVRRTRAPLPSAARAACSIERR